MIYLCIYYFHFFLHLKLSLWNKSPAQRISLSFLCKSGLLVIYYFSFCLSKSIFNSPSFSKDVFATEQDLEHWRYYPINFKLRCSFESNFSDWFLLFAFYYPFSLYPSLPLPPVLLWYFKVWVSFWLFVLDFLRNFCVCELMLSIHLGKFRAIMYVMTCNSFPSVV